MAYAMASTCHAATKTAVSISLTVTLPGKKTTITAVNTLSLPGKSQVIIMAVPTTNRLPGVGKVSAVTITAMITLPTTNTATAAAMPAYSASTAIANSDFSIPGAGYWAYLQIGDATVDNTGGHARLRNDKNIVINSRSISQAVKLDKFYEEGTSVTDVQYTDVLLESIIFTAPNGGKPIEVILVIECRYGGGNTGQPQEADVTDEYLMESLRPF
ncbi:hypothetical protein P153DRAFT_410825 [Dothidotthia symphoricarpi CBS 119687]|uniref:Uncharacterized protein n=1 Tax=Dothidotthia symphoricarpi CBS 119687 TaxID=1392245 RepID=A0A6A6A2V5_9PLEO|nr:uncharacterized protein P153DRAFT_410825 [Dothidotthia symphoricarpi CBS 119687]KAF2125237.1 hypothetical protein P153DRAFT_410825 [Dothidotthia symphoricarpi CBS 119687]